MVVDSKRFLLLELLFLGLRRKGLQLREFKRLLTYHSREDSEEEDADDLCNATPNLPNVPFSLRSRASGHWHGGTIALLA
jgi:hypothetical protein